MIDATPTPNVLRSLCASNLGWRLSIAELIDNALDAGATEIEVSLSGKKNQRGSKLTVADNGVGTADLSPFAILGDHEPHETTRLGRYGVGAKDSALYIGGALSTFSVVSTHDGIERRLNIDWMAMARNDWKIKDPSAKSSEQSSGTTVTVSPFIHNMGATLWKLLADHIGYLYSPAIKRGARITFTRNGTSRLTCRWTLPAFDGEPLDTTITVAGRSARVYCGGVKDGVPNPRSGLTYVHGFRVIRAACTAGCGNYNVARVCGFVELDDSWPLTKNKDDILHDSAALYELVLTACGPVLERAHEKGIDLHSSAFEAEVSDLFNAAFSKVAKAKRGKGETKGTQKPKGTERRHKRAQREQPGTTFTSSKFGGRVSVTHDSFGDGGTLPGRCLPPRLVILNRDNAGVALALETKNTFATVLIALSLVVGTEAIERGTTQLKFSACEASGYERFSFLMGAVLSTMTVGDGVPV